jgi:hypothetical protein
MNEAPIIKGLLEVINPTSEIMFIIRNIRVNLLLPKFFNIPELFARRIRVRSEASVYKIPTKFSLIIWVKKTELIYAEIEICKAKMKASVYILFIFDDFIFDLSNT